MKRERPGRHGPRRVHREIVKSCGWRCSGGDPSFRSLCNSVDELHP
jgi:hypothetical protein